MSRDSSREDGSLSSWEQPKLLRLLVGGTRAVEGRLYEGLREAGYVDIRPAHYAVFRHLGSEGLWVTELAEAAGMTKQSMGELVDHLERCGYVERRPDPRDGRAKVVVPTEAGRRGIRAAADRISEIEAELAERMGAERLEELTGSLAELVAVLGEIESTREGSAGEIR